MHGLEWVESAFDPGSSDGSDINDEITPNGCLGPALIASRVFDKLQGNTTLRTLLTIASHGPQFHYFERRPFMVNSETPAIWVYLVSNDPTEAPTKLSIDRVQVFIALVWSLDHVGPIPAYHPGASSVTHYIRSFLMNDPNLSVTVNTVPCQLALDIDALPETYFSISSDDSSYLGIELGVEYTVRIDLPTGQIKSVVQAGG